MKFFSTLNGLGQHHYGEYSPPITIKLKFICLGLTQSTPPAQCVHNLWIETDRQDLYIMPGVVNCISCNIVGDVAWQIEVDGDPVPIISPTAAQLICHYCELLAIWLLQCLRTVELGHQEETRLVQIRFVGIANHFHYYTSLHLLFEYCY